LNRPHTRFPTTPPAEAERQKYLREFRDTLVSLDGIDDVLEQDNIAFDGVKKLWIELKQRRDADSMYRDFPKEGSGADVPLAGKAYEKYRAEHFAQLADILRKRT
jgi:hypothetical protein